MGWIKRNWFWYTHHSLYVEPTEEEKERDRVKARKSKMSLAAIMGMTHALTGGEYL